MDIPRPVVTRLENDDPAELIHELEESRLYRPDQEYEDRHFETLYGLDTRPSGKWKYDHVLGTHSILYDPEDEEFDLRRTEATTYLQEGLHKIFEGIQDRLADENVDGTERYGFLLEDDAIDAYQERLEDDEQFCRDLRQGATVYRSDEATVRMVEDRHPEEEQRYADVDVEIPVGAEVPGASLLVNGQRRITFDGELEAKMVYVEESDIEDLVGR